MWLESIKIIVPEIAKFLDRRKAKKKQAFEALEAILRAANRTSIFITKSIKGTYKSNLELSDLWMDAAAKVRDLDNDLYDRLLEKAEYWTNPVGWSDERIQQARIGLLDLKRDAKGMLNRQ